MLRRRDIAASPVRSASATWHVISDLVAATFAKSSSIDESDVRACMAAAAGVGRLLVAGGHLKEHPVTIIGGMVHCEIRAVTGTDAFKLDEDLTVVVGATNATDFTVYLPTPAPLGEAIAAAAAANAHLSVQTPAGSQAARSAESSMAAAVPQVDADALRRLGGGR